MAERAAPPSPIAPPAETTFDYWQRKNDELALLRDHLQLGKGPAVVTVPDLVREKLGLRATMLARFAQANPLVTESNLGPAQALDLDGATVSWSYQRYDMRVGRRPFAPWFYPGLDGNDLASLGLLAASGMSALAATLTALDLLSDEPRPLYLAPGSYFETHQFVRDYLRHLRPERSLPELPATGGVLLLDSICAENPATQLARRRLAPLHAVILDTTCYDASAPEIRRVVERCRAEGVPCLLVRSHIKIDSLGLEYGRLGSIVVVLPRPCPPWRGQLVRALRRRMADFLVKAGAGFPIASYFPLTTDERFRRLNRQRNERMVEFNLACALGVARALARRSSVRVGSYHHGRFFFLRIPPAPRREGGAAGGEGSEVQALAGALLEAGVFARPAPSFAYDFAAVTRMVEPQLPEGISLRVSLPDHPADLVAPCVDAIARFATALAPLS